MYNGTCEVFDYHLTYSTYDGTNVIYTLIFNVTVIDDSSHPIDPDCCYTAIVYGNEVVYQYTGENSTEEHPVGSNTSCFYRDKNTKYPHKGDMSSDIWIGGGSVVANSNQVWIILIVIGSIITCFPCIFAIYLRYKTRENPPSYITLNL